MYIETITDVDYVKLAIFLLCIYILTLLVPGGVKTTQRFLEAHLLKKFSTEPYPKPLCKIMKNALLFDKKRKKFLFLSIKRAF